MTSSPHFRLILDALDDYAKETGIDLTKNPFSTSLQSCNSPDEVLQLIRDKTKAFKEFRQGNRRLIDWLKPVVNVVHAFAGTLGQGISLHGPAAAANAIFSGVDVLIVTASNVSAGYDALVDLFEIIGNFLKRLHIYTQIPSTPAMTDVTVKIMVEILSVLALATKNIKEGRLMAFAKKLLGESEIEEVLRRLDRLTQEEARATVAQTLEVVHGLMNTVKVVMDAVLSWTSRRFSNLSRPRRYPYTTKVDSSGISSITSATPSTRTEGCGGGETGRGNLLLIRSHGKRMECKRLSVVANPFLTRLRRFRWVVCQLEILRRRIPSSIRSALDEMPSSLDSTYENLLLGIEEEKQEYAHRIFQCLAVSVRPLSVPELAEVLAVRFDAGASPNFNVGWRSEDAEEVVLSACSSLISVVNVGGYRIVQFSHFSVKEYLASNRLATLGISLSRYHILPASAHTILARICLTFLLKLDDSIDRNFIQDRPLALYAARHWVDH
ncbi:hypothetical protein EI94DRAFT_1561374, partial [Lactarius quietus]